MFVHFCVPSELSATRLTNPRPEKNNDNILIFQVKTDFAEFQHNFT